ncbi:tetratricopeptide repeat protein [Phormidium tenue FACHB-886]|nr:tetratricopeptide repeat protein [Phormidium tenue FACHB-886]
MNTRSFAGRNKKSNNPQHSTGTGISFRAFHAQKRWQPKQDTKNVKSDVAASAASSGKAPSSESCVPPTLSLAEQETLLRQQALAFAHQGDRSAALSLFNALLARNPQSAIDYSNRGLVYFQNGQADQALADYDKAIELNPRLDSAYNNRANYYAAQGQYLEAILDYDIALDLNPANVRAWINQGITFRELEMYDRALESFDLALCLNRLEGHIYAERGRTEHLRGDWNCAIADYKRALEKLPQFTESTADSAVRLRVQVEGWKNELFNVALEGDAGWKL